ncbi:nicotinate-nucleotide--dimethylbenzimidazole phosphoribosyltransferase [Bradyrhizobium betae]
MRLGEGSGAAIALPLVRLACAAFTMAWPHSRRPTCLDRPEADPLVDRHDAPAARETIDPGQ